MRKTDLVQDPVQLSKRCWRELCELVEQGEIDPEIAQRIRDDLFEAGGLGEPPVLKTAAYRSQLEDLQRYAEVNRMRLPWFRRLIG